MRGEWWLPAGIRRLLEELSALGADLVISLAQEHGALVAFRDALVQEKMDLILDYGVGRAGRCPAGSDNAEGCEPLI